MVYDSVGTASSPLLVSCGSVLNTKCCRCCKHGEGYLTDQVNSMQGRAHTPCRHCPVRSASTTTCSRLRPIGTCFHSQRQTVSQCLGWLIWPHNSTCRAVYCSRTDTPCLPHRPSQKLTPRSAAVQVNMHAARYPPPWVKLSSIQQFMPHPIYTQELALSTL